MRKTLLSASDDSVAAKRDLRRTERGGSETCFRLTFSKASGTAFLAAHAQRGLAWVGDLSIEWTDTKVGGGERAMYESEWKHGADLPDELVVVFLLLRS